MLSSISIKLLEEGMNMVNENESSGLRLLETSVAEAVDSGSFPQFADQYLSGRNGSRDLAFSVLWMATANAGRTRRLQEAGTFVQSSEGYLSPQAYKEVTRAYQAMCRFEGDINLDNDTALINLAVEPEVRPYQNALDYLVRLKEFQKQQKTGGQQ